MTRAILTESDVAKLVADLVGAGTRVIAPVPAGPDWERDRVPAHRAARRGGARRTAAAPLAEGVLPAAAAGRARRARAAGDPGRSPVRRRRGRDARQRHGAGLPGRPLARAPGGHHHRDHRLPARRELLLLRRAGDRARLDPRRGRHPRPPRPHGRAAARSRGASPSSCGAAWTCSSSTRSRSRAPPSSSSPTRSPRRSRARDALGRARGDAQGRGAPARARRAGHRSRRPRPGRDGRSDRP